MNKSSVVKKFDALASKYGFDQGNLLDMYDIEDEINIIRHTLYVSSELNTDRRATRDFETEDGQLTAYGVVAVKCVYLMRWCIQCFDSETTVLVRQRSQQDVILRKCSLAYEVYWHFNGDLLLRTVMNNTLDSSILDTPFLRNAGTFQHPDLDADYHQQVFKIVSEIVNLLFRHSGDLPKKSKPGLKPWLLATKTTSQGWQLPSQRGRLSLTNIDDIQIIKGGRLLICLDYVRTSLNLGPFAQVTGCTVTVSYQDKIIYSGEFPFVINLDRNNDYRLIVDRWYAGGFGWLTDMLMQQQKKTRAIAGYLEEIEPLMLEACGNFLEIIHPKQRAEIYEYVYLQELELHHFDSNLFGRLQPEFLSCHLCTTAVTENYLCLEFLPDHARKELDIGLAALNGARTKIERTVWGHIFSHTEMPLEDLAKAYIREAGADGYVSLPRRLKTANMLKYTVETHPDCLNYTSNPGVFANWDELEAFLNRQTPGLAKQVQSIMDISDCSPRQAYEDALATMALDEAPESLPAFDFSDCVMPA